MSSTCTRRTALTTAALLTAAGVTPLREVMPLVEREYGAGTRRAAAGESRGGFGVLGMAARVPGLFRAVAGFGAPVHPVRHAEMWLSGATYVGVDGYRIFGDP